MSDVNKVILIGGVVQEPKALGKALKVRLATSRSWKTDSGTKTATEYHDVIVGERQAAYLAPFLTKGKKIYVEGRIEYREVNGKYFTDIRADVINLLGESSGGKALTQGGAVVDTPVLGGLVADTAVFDDDIPF
jgi:single-strand DNA-binding protein